MAEPTHHDLMHEVLHLKTRLRSAEIEAVAANDHVRMLQGEISRLSRIIFELRAVKRGR